jgi:hypothetical protein
MHTNVSAAAATIFSRVCAPPPALDEREIGVHFVGAVDVDGERGDVVEVEDADAELLERLRAALRRRHSACERDLALAEEGDEVVHRRARADAQDLTRLHVVERGCGGRALQIVLAHSPSSS